MDTDASEHYWAGALTQIMQKNAAKPQEEQRHEPLAFVSGAFSRAISRWSICEKLDLAMVYSMAQTDQYTACAETSIYTDHRNLVFIFDPLKSHPNMPAYWVSKIQRWALILSQFEYVVSHVPGEFNYFPDLITRWGAAPKVRRLYVPIPDVESQTYDKDALLENIREAQKAMPPAEATMLTAGRNTSHGFLSRDGKIYVPKSVTQIKIDLLIMSHCGPAGHKGQAVTSNHLKDNFT